MKLFTITLESKLQSHQMLPVSHNYCLTIHRNLRCLSTGLLVVAVPHFEQTGVSEVLLDNGKADP